MTLCFKQQGSGPALVLIHGTGGSRETWAPVFDRLSAHRKTYAIDLPGFGASPPLSGVVPSVSALAEVLAEWMDQQGLDRPHVAGSSLGGAIALELAKSNHVASATALSPIGFWSDWEFAYSALTLRLLRRGAKLTAPVAPLLLGNPVGRTLSLWVGTGRPWRMSGEEAISAGKALAKAPSFLEVLDAAKSYRFEVPQRPLSVPIAIGWGKRDRTLFRRQGRRAHKALPEASFAWLPGCGHVPIADDRELIAEFILAASRNEIESRTLPATGPRRGNAGLKAGGSLTHPMRRRILRYLHICGEPKGASEVAKALDQPISQISYHLKVLESDGTIREVGLSKQDSQMHESAVNENDEVLELLETTEADDDEDMESEGA